MGPSPVTSADRSARPALAAGISTIDRRRNVRAADCMSALRLMIDESALGPSGFVDDNGLEALESPVATDCVCVRPSVPTESPGIETVRAADVDSDDDNDDNRSSDNRDIGAENPATDTFGRVRPDAAARDETPASIDPSETELASSPTERSTARVSPELAKPEGEVSSTVSFSVRVENEFSSCDGPANAGCPLDAGAATDRASTGHFGCAWSASASSGPRKTRRRNTRSPVALWVGNVVARDTTLTSPPTTPIDDGLTVWPSERDARRSSALRWARSRFEISTSKDREIVGAETGVIGGSNDQAGRTSFGGASSSPPWESRLYPVESSIPFAWSACVSALPELTCGSALPEPVSAGWGDASKRRRMKSKSPMVNQTWSVNERVKK